MFVKAKRAPMSGSVTLQAWAEIPPGERPFLETVKLRGGFGVGEGGFSKLHTQESVNKLSAGASGEKRRIRSGDRPHRSDRAIGAGGWHGKVVRSFFWSPRCCLPSSWNIRSDQPQDRPARPAESGDENIEHHERGKSNLAENDGSVFQEKTQRRSAAVANFWDI